MGEANWLDALKPGDTVIVYDHPYERIAAVVKRDKVKIVARCEGYSYDDSFSAKHGRAFGDSDWRSKKLSEASPTRVAKIREVNRRTKLTTDIGNAQLESRTTEVLEAVAALLYPDGRPR